MKRKRTCRSLAVKPRQKRLETHLKDEIAYLRQNYNKAKPGEMILLFCDLIEFFFGDVQTFPRDQITIVFSGHEETVFSLEVIHTQSSEQEIRLVMDSKTEWSISSDKVDEWKRKLQDCFVQHYRKLLNVKITYQNVASFQVYDCELFSISRDNCLCTVWTVDSKLRE
jgi:hypothetical protein